MVIQSHPPITVVKLTGNANRHSNGAAAVTQKQYLRKINRGKIQKLCREHYLQNDIPCGLSGCSDCLRILSTILLDYPSQEPLDQDDAMEIEETSEIKKKRRKILLLSETGRTGHRKYTQKHYLVLDTNVVLRQIDLLEAFTFGTSLIGSQTVLDEVRHRSLPISNRLKSLIDETTQRPDESINDRNDRAIGEVCKWYKAHLSSHNLDVVLLTDDRASFEKATQHHIHASTTKD